MSAPRVAVVLGGAGFIGRRLVALLAGEPVAGGRPAALYRVPEQPSLDGNTVDAQKESAAIAETATRYQASLAFLDMRIRNLRMAITGGR